MQDNQTFDTNEYQKKEPLNYSENKKGMNLSGFTDVVKESLLFGIAVIIINSIFLGYPGMFLFGALLGNNLFENFVNSSGCNEMNCIGPPILLGDILFFIYSFLLCFVIDYILFASFKSNHVQIIRNRKSVIVIIFMSTSVLVYLIGTFINN